MKFTFQFTFFSRMVLLFLRYIFTFLFSYSFPHCLDTPQTTPWNTWSFVPDPQVPDCEILVWVLLIGLRGREERKKEWLFLFFFFFPRLICLPITGKVVVSWRISFLSSSPFYLLVTNPHLALLFAKFFVTLEPEDKWEGGAATH